VRRRLGSRRRRTGSCSPRRKGEDLGGEAQGLFDQGKGKADHARGVVYRSAGPHQDATAGLAVDAHSAALQHGERALVDLRHFIV